jgi:hypothetical protein
MFSSCPRPSVRGVAPPGAQFGGPESLVFGIAPPGEGDSVCLCQSALAASCLLLLRHPGPAHKGMRSKRDL